MRTFTLAIIAVLTMALAACSTVGDYLARPQVVGSGKLLTKNFQFNDFTEVQVGNAFQVEITRADTFSVSVTTDDNLFDHLRVEKQGNALRIFFAPDITVRQMSRESQAKITLPALERLNLSGATTGAISGFKSAQSFDANISGASKLSGDIEVGNARIEASGASSVTLSGSAKNTTLIASGASQLNLANFAIESASVELSGGSNGTINAQSKLDYYASGASHLTYSGKPSIGKSQTTGASSATRK
ncbi:MAG: DUF2807 domain-containing protein [Chloroflexi bacterium]|nr:DUF2807 domain-containing protein [Chloroflexota bacterium]